MKYEKEHRDKMAEKAKERMENMETEKIANYQPTKFEMLVDKVSYKEVKKTLKHLLNTSMRVLKKTTIIASLILNILVSIQLLHWKYDFLIDGNVLTQHSYNAMVCFLISAVLYLLGYIVREQTSSKWYY